MNWRMLAALLTISLVIPARAALADALEWPVFGDCQMWSSFGESKARRLEGVVDLGGGSVNGFADRGGDWLPGHFEFHDVRLARWSEIEKPPARGLLLVTVPKNLRVTFVPDSLLYKRMQVAGGYIEDHPDLRGYWQKPPKPVTCVPVSDPHPGAAEMVSAATGGSSIIILGSDSDDGDRVSGGAIKDMIRKYSKAGDAKAKDSSGDGESMIGKMMAAITAAAGTDTVSPNPAKVCRLGGAAPLDLPVNVDPTGQAYTVGLRNSERSSRAFDLVRVAGTTIDRGLEVDLSDSINRLMVYDPPAGMTKVLVDGKSVDVTPVSLEGIHGSAAHPIPSGKAAPVPAAKVNLKFIVAGAAKEVGMSGLDEVGKLLARKGDKEIALSIDWYPMDEKGDLQPARHYTSFKDLVDDAAKDSGKRFMVLDASQFKRFMDGFQKALLAIHDPVDRILWVKGPYKLPAEAPSAIEQFARAVGEGAVVPRLPNGVAEKWLIAISARIPGFSVAYIKEPIYSLGVGEVFDEPVDNDTDPRRLLVKPGTLATEFQSLATLRAVPEKKAAASEPTQAITDLLVFDGNRVFSEEGYVLSMAAMESLVRRLGALSVLVDKEAGGFDPSDPTFLRLTAEVDKDHPSVADILQRGGLKGFELPMPLPSWLRTPVDALSSAERGRARDFVRDLFDRVKEAAGSAKKALVDRGTCRLVYMPATELGLEKALE